VPPYGAAGGYRRLRVDPRRPHRFPAARLYTRAMTTIDPDTKLSLTVVSDYI
jgi:hypothetical protein